MCDYVRYGGQIEARPSSGRPMDMAVAVVALAFSYWMIIGGGAETVYKGLLMVLAGVPVYVWMLSPANRRRSGEPSVIPRA